MNDDPTVTHDNRCAVCGDELEDAVDFDFEMTRTGEEGGYLNRAFCSWEHAAEWVGRGEPTWPTYDDEGGFQPACLVLAVIALLVLTLIVIGTITVARWIF